MKSGEVDVVHVVVLQHEAIVPVFIGITQHGSHFLVGAMIVALVVAFEATAQQVFVDIDRAHGVVGHRHMYGDECLTFVIYTFHIIVK